MPFNKFIQPASTAYVSEPLMSINPTTGELKTYPAADVVKSIVPFDVSGKISSSVLPATSSAVTSVNSLTGAVVLTKSSVGLSNVDNTSDLSKPISTAQQTALNLKADQSTVTTALATKEATITAGTTTQYLRGDKTFQTLDKTAVGLSNVDNTSDASKPISTAQATVNATKENTLPTGTAAQYFKGDKTLGTLDAAAVGLGNVNNTSDASKPVSTAQATAIAAVITAIPDNLFSIAGDGDATKVLKFNADTINTTASTKTLGINPLFTSTGTIPLQETANAFSAAQTVTTTASTGTVSSQTLNATNANTTATSVQSRAIRTVLTGTANANDRANLLYSNLITQTAAANNVIIGTGYTPSGMDFVVASTDSFRTPSGPNSTLFIKGDGEAKFKMVYTDVQSAVSSTAATTITKGVLTIGLTVTAGDHIVNLPNHVAVSTSGQLIGTDFVGARYTINNKRYAGSDTATITPVAGATIANGFLFGLSTLVLQPGEIVTLDWSFVGSTWIVASRYNANIQEIVVNNIDLITTGVKTLFTAPVGRKFSVENLKLLPLSVVGSITTVATASVDSTSVGDVYPSTPLTNFNSSQKEYNFNNAGGKTSLQSATALNLNVTTATAGATVHSVQAILKIRCIG